MAAEYAASSFLLRAHEEQEQRPFNQQQLPLAAQGKRVSLGGLSASSGDDPSPTATTRVFPWSSSASHGQLRREEPVEASRRRHLTIANLVSDSPSTYDEYTAAQDRKEGLSVAVKQEEPPKSKISPTGNTGASTASSIPAAFQHTQAFQSARDFFVPPTLDAPTDGSRLVCTICQLTLGNRVYSLKRHLVRHHPHVFRVDHLTASVSRASSPVESTRSAESPERPEQERVVLASNVNGSPSSSVLGKRKLPSSNKAGEGTTAASERMNNAFVQWLNSDVIPMGAIESPRFRAFLALVNPNFKLPSVVVRPPPPVPQSVGPTESNPIKSKPPVMTAVCIQGDGKPPRVVRDVPVPTPAPNEALVRVLRAGICGTDLQMVKNYKPGFAGALGHEFVGIVEQLGTSFTGDVETQQRWLGQRVVGEINVPCDSPDCSTCSCVPPHERTSYPLSDAAVRRRNHCPKRTCLGILDKHGAFADFLTLPLANLRAVPDGVVDAHAVFAEPLSAAYRLIEQHAIGPDDDVAVLGDGKLGLLVAEALHATQAAKSVTLIGRHRDKLELAKHLVSTVITVNEGDSPPSILSKRDGRLFDVCVEVTGSPSGVSTALALVRTDGTVVIKSTTAAPIATVDWKLLHRKRARLLGSRCGPIPEAIRLLRDKRVDVQKYIAGVYPLDRAERALHHAATRGTLKVQLLMGDGP